LTTDALPLFYKALCGLSNEMHRHYLLLCLLTGPCRAEASALTWEEVDFANRSINLRPMPAKSKRPLSIPMSDIVSTIPTVAE
jgi:integrase